MRNRILARSRGNILSRRIRADLALLFCSLVWGGTFIVVKDALADVSIFTYIAVRFALAAAVMAVLFWRALRGLNRHAIWAGVQIGFFMFGGYAFQTTGLKFTTASKAALRAYRRLGSDCPDHVSAMTCDRR